MSFHPAGDQPTPDAEKDDTPAQPADTEKNDTPEAKTNDTPDPPAADPNQNKVLPNAESIRSVGGLIAVVVAVIAVTALAIATMAFIDSAKDANAEIPLATAAFGVISALVGAYLGIKIGTDQSTTFARDANQAHAQLGAMQGFVPQDQQQAAQQAAADAAALSTKGSPPSGS